MTGSCLTQEVAIRTVKQSPLVREAENGEEGEEEGAEFGEEDLFHQQVGFPGACSCMHAPPSALLARPPKLCSRGLPMFWAKLALADL